MIYYFAQHISRLLIAITYRRKAKIQEFSCHLNRTCCNVHEQDGLGYLNNSKFVSSLPSNEKDHLKEICALMNQFDIAGGCRTQKMP